MGAIAERRVKTRKPHRCFGCDQLYPTGSSMRCITWRDQDGIRSYHWCDVCDEVWKREGMRYDDEIHRGDLYDEDWLSVQAELATTIGRTGREVRSE